MKSPVTVKSPKACIARILEYRQPQNLPCLLLAALLAKCVYQASDQLGVTGAQLDSLPEGCKSLLGFAHPHREQPVFAEAIRIIAVEVKCQSIVRESS